MTRLHINLQQLQEGNGTAKETLDSHVSQMIAKRTASKFFIDDDDDAHHAKELEAALLAAHEDVYNMRKRIEDVEEALQGGCEECLAAAQDTMRLRLCLVQPSKTVPSVSSAEGSLASGGPSESSMQDHSQGSASKDGAEGMGQRVANNKDGNDLMGMVHLAAAAMVTALAQTAHPALKPTAVDPSPLFLGPFRALLRCNGVLKDLIALVMSCHTCTGGPIPIAPSPSTIKHNHRSSSARTDSQGNDHQERGDNSSQGPEAGAAVPDARAASRPASALQHGRANDAHNTAASRPASALQHGRGSRAPSRRPSAASIRSGGGRTPSSAQLSHRSHASDTPSMAGSQSRGGAVNASSKPGNKDAGAGNTTEAPAGEHCMPPLGVPPPINDPPPLTPVAIATRLVVAAGVVHLLASDEPVGQHQLWQLLAYMQHQSATANAGAALLSDLIAQAEHETNEEELMAANQGHQENDTETDTSYSRTALAHTEAVHGLRSLHAALGGCEALPPFMAACMWCLCRHENSRKGLIVGDSEAWVALIEGWLRSGIVAVNQHHCILQPDSVPTP
ncbi:hypothetical protein DUNSADRAFT_5592 [Dunaliella salina]|uniref:Uncharacterized protein n=1 Tax=Dunaliella salina TaxID=3046 RepID=A0ABZ3L5G8_DUNSA|nr:hypothetical protein DUNSADRAFT_5592 [Dunaliella salina]|eukprot:KAF5836666.1 hypothetical protein DUNSADRAFT_5592 [Dunaliella salina]